MQQVDVVNAHSGTFTLSYGGSPTTPFTYGSVTHSDIENALVALSGVGKTNGVDNLVVADNGTNSWRITFNGGTLAGIDVAQLNGDASQLKGALQDGNLSDEANFDVTLTNQPTVTATITTDGTSSVTGATIGDGGAGFGVSTVTQGSGVEVQDVTVAGNASGTFTLSFNSSSSGSITRGATAAAVQTALNAIGALTGKVTVVKSTANGGGSTYRVIFNGLTGDQSQLVATGTGVTVATVGNGGAGAVNEVQKITIRGASGTYKLRLRQRLHRGPDLDTAERRRCERDPVGRERARHDAPDRASEQRVPERRHGLDHGIGRRLRHRLHRHVRRCARQR